MTPGESLSLLVPFVGAELFKLRRSRLVKATIVATAVASPMLTGITWLLLSDEKTSTFPLVLELIYLPLWLLAGLSGLLLTVEVLGNEFEFGTARAIMGRGTPRWLFVGGKALALLIAVAFNAMAGACCGGIFAIISHLSQIGTTGLTEALRGFLISFLPATGTVILSGLAYVGILSLLVVLTRSSALAMLGGLVIFGGDFFIETFDAGFDVGAYSIIYSTYALLTQTIGTGNILGHSDTGPGEPDRAFFILGLYAAAGVLLAYYALKQQDLASKS